MFKNNEKGITLVVLIITVVVLLILSGVTISMIVTDNGIINKTQKAKQNVEDVTTDTQTRLNELYSQGTYIDEIYGTIEDLEDINDEYEEFRRAIAESIGQAGGESPDYTAAASVYREKINGILSKATELNEDIAATSEDISEGKKAWVNGELITGEAAESGVTGNFTVDNVTAYNQSSYDTKSITLTRQYTFTSPGVYLVNVVVGKSGTYSLGTRTLTGTDNIELLSGYGASQIMTYGYGSNPYVYTYKVISNGTETIKASVNLTTSQTATSKNSMGMMVIKVE